MSSSRSDPNPPRRTLLVFCDSLSYYGPTGGLPADDPRIWPNIVASQLDWDVELIGRIGWTCRDVWWAAIGDPRAWAALPRAGAVIFATSRHGLPAVAVADRRARTDPLRAPAVVAPLGARRIRLVAAAVVARRASRAAAPPERRISRTDPHRNRLQPAGHPVRGVDPVGARRRDLRQVAPLAGRHRRGDHRVGTASTTCRSSTSRPQWGTRSSAAAAIPTASTGTSRPTERWPILMMKGLAEAGVVTVDSGG